MPPHYRLDTPSPPRSQSPTAFVDLTSSPSHNMPPKRKRNAPDPIVDVDNSRDAAGPSIKRTRRTAPVAGPRPKSSSGANEASIEQVDLVDDDNTLSRTLQRQREEQIKQQQAPSDRDKPAKLSTLTCVICLETPTDLTATNCGHLFCHHCLMEALIAGENRAIGAGESRKSQCPVCRKNISRTGKGHVIPLQMKKGQPKKQQSQG